jgi:hypothetical protein
MEIEESELAENLFELSCIPLEYNWEQLQGRTSFTSPAKAAAVRGKTRNGPKSGGKTTHHVQK